MNRRHVFHILTAAAARRANAQHSDQRAPASAKPDKTYQPRYFSQPQYQLIEILTEMILPADELGPGARDASVARYIDTVVLHAAKDVQGVWGIGLDAVESLSRDRFAKPFAALDAQDRAALLGRIAVNEADPSSDLDRFFIRLKQMTIDAYCFSEEGRKFLGYRGDSASFEFPGCTHPEHQS
jgi:hypothetical protein